MNLRLDLGSLRALAPPALAVLALIGVGVVKRLAKLVLLGVAIGFVLAIVLLTSMSGTL